MVPPATLLGWQKQPRQNAFRDEDFAALYRAHNGRPSVPPSLAVSMLYLRAYDKVSFLEAIERTHAPRTRHVLRIQGRILSRPRLSSPPQSHRICGCITF
jgi:hypothetical protein